MFTNLQFTPNNVSPPDTVAENCWRVDPHTCVGIFLFDLFVLNNDRDRKNLYVDNPARPKEILIYDHDVALSEAMYNEAAIRFKRDKDAFLTYHMLLPVIDSDSRFLHWIKRIQSIPDWFLKDICDEVVSRDFTQTESNACRKFLRHRQDNLLYIVNKHRDRFLKSMKWSLKLT